MPIKPNFQPFLTFDGSRFGKRAVIVFGTKQTKFPFDLLSAAGIDDPSRFYYVESKDQIFDRTSDLVKATGRVKPPGTPMPDFSSLKGYEIRTWHQGVKQGDVTHWLLVDPARKPAAYKVTFNPRFSALTDVVIPAMKVFGTMAGLINMAVSAATVAPSVAGSGLTVGESQVFDSFEFSWGESSSVASDASIVDYGFNDMTVDFGLNDIPTWQFEPTSFFEAAPETVNSLGESSVSWFGNVDYGFPEISDVFQTAKDAVNVAGEVAKTVYNVKNLFGNTPSSGGAVRTPGTARPSYSQLTPNQQLALQRESAQQRDFVGQLVGMRNPDGSIDFGKIALLAGGAIVVYALVKG